MKRVLIVTPHFPPINAPDMQRVRMSLPYFGEFNWHAAVLAVDPRDVVGLRDEALLNEIPRGVDVHLVRAIPVGLTRKLGIGSVGLRSFFGLFCRGRKLIRRFRPDIVFISSTVFVVMPLARLWKIEFGVPYVLDIQDPWYSDYYKNRPRSQRPPKYLLSNAIDRVLEKWTMRGVDGLISVSDAYVASLRARHPRLDAVPSLTLPFGADEREFESIRSKIAIEEASGAFGSSDLVNVYYVGSTHEMTRALTIIFQAFSRGLQEHAELFSKVRIHFIGTSYAPRGKAIASVMPIAIASGVGNYVSEVTDRVPYASALALLEQSQFLIMPGSDDSQYTASKLFSYVLAKKPLLAVFHRKSIVVELIRKLRAGIVVTFDDVADDSAAVDTLFASWEQLLRNLPFTPATDWTVFDEYSARGMTRKQLSFFDQIVRSRF